MKNIERVREMTPEELTQLVNNRCQMCVYQNQSCLHDRCSEGVIQWLNQESYLTIKEVCDEFDKFCSYSYRKPECCMSCEYENTTCKYNYIVDHFNIINGKIARRQK